MPEVEFSIKDTVGRADMDFVYAEETRPPMLVKGGSPAFRALYGTCESKGLASHH